MAKYSYEFKKEVVNAYLNGEGGHKYLAGKYSITGKSMVEVSYHELALSVGMNNPPLITKWVNDFRIAGPDALRPKQKGRKKSLESKVCPGKGIAMIIQ